MVFPAVLIVIFSVLYILNQGIEQQTEAVLDDLHVQSLHRVRSGNKVLQDFIANYIVGFQYVTADISHNETIREGIVSGQWQSISGQLDTIGKRVGLDFVVIFDARGRVQTSWPREIDAKYPETHFRDLALLRSFEKYIDNEDLVDAPTFSSFERWSHKVHEGYGADIDEDAGLVIISAGVIPNDYFDEPIGYVLTGIKSSRLSATFEGFSQTTGQLSLLADGRTPLAWGGLSGDIKAVHKSLRSLGPEQIKNSISGDSVIEFKHAGEAYFVRSIQLRDYSGTTAVAT